MSDRHLIVIENDQQIGADMAGMCKGFKRHAAGDGTIADDRNDFSVWRQLAGSDCHTHGCRNAGGAVPNAKGIEFTFGTLGESREATSLTDGMHAIRAPRYDLVRVGLVADIPDDAIFGGVENMVQGDGQFDNT